ncbi:MAG: hypothetical protein HYS56_02760 [Candidatus Omnitrophica bacterium]|nr:hypothetical protein [Candidatus Omnitrophota bacterium]
MRRGIVLLLLVIMAAGCAGRGKMVHEQRYKKRLELTREQNGLLYEFQFTPPKQKLVQEGVEIEVEPVSHTFLNGLFNDKRIFGAVAGLNPYLPQTLVFYVKVSNNGAKKIFVNPGEATLLDDLSSQYNFLSPDYVVALSLAKGSAAQSVKTISGAAPGFYGAGLGFATAFARDPEERRLSLLNIVTLTSGMVYPGVVYDGYIAFLKPSHETQEITLILPNIRMDFNAQGEAEHAIDFVFDFGVKA